MKSIWQTQVGEISNEGIKRLVFELALIRSWEPVHVERERLFSFVQVIFRDARGKYARVPSNCAVPKGLLLTKIGELEPSILKDALADLGKIKNEPMYLEAYENKTVLMFLNEFHNTRKARPQMFYKPL